MSTLKRFRIIMTENGISPRLDPEGEWLRYSDAAEVIEALKWAHRVIQEDRDEIFASVTVAGDESTMDEIDRPHVARMDVALAKIGAALAKAEGTA